MPRRHKKAIGITFDPTLLKRIDRLAKQHDASRSSMIERLCRDAITDAEAHAKVVTNPVVMEAFSQAMSAPGVISSMVAAMGEELTDEQQLQLRDLMKNYRDIEKGTA